MKLAAQSFALMLLCSAPALAGPQAIAGQGLAPVSASRVGEKLLVLWQGAYWPAAVTGDQGHGRVRIHYDGYGPEWDETITSERIRHEVAHAAPEVGRTLYVGWGGALWPAKIMHAAHGRFSIHYLGWGDEWDEVVGQDRLHWLGSR